MWESDCEEGWVPKNWCFWTVVLEKTLESSLDCKKIQPVHSKGDQSWMFFGRTDALEHWCWRRLLRVPWTARRSNRSILKEIIPEYSLEGLMLTLKLQYFGHLMRRTDLMEKTLLLGKIKGRRRRGQQMRWLDEITDLMDMNLSKIWQSVRDREAWHAAVHGVTKSQARFSDWTELNFAPNLGQSSSQFQISFPFH